MMTRIQRLAVRARVSSKIRRLKISRKSFRVRRSVLRRLGLSRFTYGVNLVAYIRAEMGLGQAARGIASAMQAADIPFGIVNFGEGNLSPQTNREWSHKEVKKASFDVTLICINPDNVDNLRAVIPNNVLSNRYLIAYWFWELPEIPDKWTEEFSMINEVWAPSKFVYDAISRKATIPVMQIPTVVQVQRANKVPPGFFGLPAGRFMFLCVCDTMSVLERKNPVGAVRAFKRAFAPTDSRAVLVLKLNNSMQSSAEVERVREEIRGQNNIYLLEQVFNRDEMNSLLDITDCVVSLHRAEGFGLVPAEAMGRGKPAILTNWSGNTDYMKADNSIAIDYELVRIGKNCGPYDSHQFWAEPDLEQTAHWMKRLVDEPGLAETIGRNARASIEAQFSPKAVGHLIRQRLDYIQNEY